MVLAHGRRAEVVCLVIMNDVMSLCVSTTIALRWMRCASRQRALVALGPAPVTGEEIRSAPLPPNVVAVCPSRRIMAAPAAARNRRWRGEKHGRKMVARRWETRSVDPRASLINPG